MGYSHITLFAKQAHKPKSLYRKLLKKVEGRGQNPQNLVNVVNESPIAPYVSNLSIKFSQSCKLSLWMAF